jgi:CRP/FNR family transcriptional regulator, cyclic AMP receptor protein
MDAMSALRASALFQTFTDTGVSILATICSPKNFPAGTPLFVENMVSDSLLVIGEGRVALSTRSDRGDLPLGELGAGEWLGELSLINTGQRLCTALAVTNVTAFEIRQADFQKLTATKPQACMKLLMSICMTFGQKVQANRDALRTLVART